MGVPVHEGHRREPARPAPRRPLGDLIRERTVRLLAWFGPARLVGGAVAVVAVAVGGWWLLHAPPPAVERSLPLTSSSAPPGATAVPGGTLVADPGEPPTAVGVVIVHVAGSVVRPGLVRLDTTGRVADAIEAAGGPLPEADLDALNLAAPLSDGTRIYVPVVGEVPAGALVSGPAAGGGSADASGPVDINRASASELDALPGIGPSTAQSIVAYRESNGPFRTVDDLLEVRGIGPAKLEQFRALVTV